MLQSANLGTHAALVPRYSGILSTWPWCFRSTARSITILLDNSKRIARLISTARSVTKILTKFLGVGYFLTLFVIIHLPLASFCISVLRKRTSHKLQVLTKSCRLPVVQSTTTGIYTCASWRYLHAVPQSLTVVPIRKLLRYSRCQSHGDKHRHLVGSHPQHHPYHIILRKCVNITHDFLSGWHVFAVVQHGAVPCTVFTVYHDSVHFLVALRGEAVMNAVPARWLWYCADTHTAYITLMAEQRSTLVVRCCQAGVASKSDAVLHKESLGLFVYNIYIHHAIHHCMVVSSCPCLLLSTRTTCGSTLRCHFPTRSFTASGQCFKAYMLQLLNIT